jgi:hypothetical protein
MSTEYGTYVSVDCETGERIEREHTQEEKNQIDADRAEFAAQEEARVVAEEAHAALKASAKAKLVSGQPLTEAEAATIVL